MKKMTQVEASKLLDIDQPKVAGQGSRGIEKWPVNRYQVDPLGVNHDLAACFISSPSEWTSDAEASLTMK